MENITGRLEGWHQDNVFPHIIWGNLFDDVHKRWREGTRIHTSNVKTPREEWAEGKVVTTLNSRYLLGKPYPVSVKV